MAFFTAIKVRLPKQFLAFPACIAIFTALLTGCGGNSTQSSQNATPLVIVTNPASQTVPLGETGTFSVTALDVSAHDTAAHVRVTVSFNADGHEPWTTAGVSGDLNQAALMAIVDGFHYWLLKNPD